MNWYRISRLLSTPVFEKTTLHHTAWVHKVRFLSHLRGKAGAYPGRDLGIGRAVATPRNSIWHEWRQAHCPDHAENCMHPSFFHVNSPHPGPALLADGGRETVLISPVGPILIRLREFVHTNLRSVGKSERSLHTFN